MRDSPHWKEWKEFRQALSQVNYYMNQHRTRVYCYRSRIGRDQDTGQEREPPAFSADSLVSRRNLYSNTVNGLVLFVVSWNACVGESWGQPMGAVRQRLAGVVLHSGQ